MALVVELYCGEGGGRDGVKLGDQVLARVVEVGASRVGYPVPSLIGLMRQ